MPASRSRQPLLIAAGGGLLFAVVLGLAAPHLPAWRTPLPATAESYRARFEEVAAQIGIDPAAAETVGVAPDVAGKELRLARSFDPEGADRKLAEAGMVIPMTASRPASWRLRLHGHLNLQLSASGEVWGAEWLPFRFIDSTAGSDPDGNAEALEAELRRLLTRPGERQGQAGTRLLAGQMELLVPLIGAEPPTYLAVTRQGQMVMVKRRANVGAPEEADIGASFVTVLLRKVPALLIAAILIGFTLWLTVNRRIDFKNASVLALLSLAIGLIGSLGDRLPGWLGFFQLIGEPIQALFLLLLWAAGESLIRSTLPGYTTHLDSLRRGRLTHPGGVSLLAGWGCGAALAALLLLVHLAAGALPGVWAESLSVRVPPLDQDSNLVGAGLYLAALVLLALALAYRFLPPGRRGLGAAVAAGLLATAFELPVSLSPWPVTAAAGVAVAGLLVLVHRRFGLTALAVSCCVAFLLPHAVFAQRWRGWFDDDLALCGIALLLPLAVGLLALARGKEIEEGEVPGFVRRLEERRRLTYEMDLLSRMQLGLLPEELPDLPGYRFDATSLLASEAGGDLYDFFEDGAGRLWIAAGDVAGHGYSCAIAQAMTKAALASLVDGRRSPAEVLGEVDRVLRRGGVHQFTSLVLVRLQPDSGELVIANGAHPYPLLADADGRVHEIELPGLPLGKGPPRSYREVTAVLPRGGLLLLYSDGLYEAMGRRGEPYGFARTRELLAAHAGRPADEVLQALVADWQRHLGGGQPPDDTTLVVIERR